MKQHRLSEGPLLDEKGHLCEAGYATELVKQYDRSRIRAAKSRIKEWDYYLIYNDRFGIALTIDDNSYMGLVSASFLDFEKAEETTVSPMFWLPFGKTGFPSSSKEGDVEKQLKGASFSFRHENGGRHLVCSIDEFKDGTPFSCDVMLTDEPEDSMVIATPFREKKTAFYYNQKIVGMRAEGEVRYNNETWYFEPRRSFGLLDWGRGVWTYENTWYWGAAMGAIAQHVVGFNIGYGFGDVSKASENMLFVDGTAHKLDRLTFNIPRDENGNDSFLEPWTFTSCDGRFEMEFDPIIDRASCTDVKLICSDQHQVFGRFNGRAILDDGTELHLSDFLGFAEKVYNKW